MEYCELLNQNKISLLEIHEWLIYVNLAITYLLTKLYINRIVKNIAIFMLNHYIYKY